MSVSHAVALLVVACLMAMFLLRRSFADVNVSAGV